MTNHVAKQYVAEYVRNKNQIIESPIYTKSVYYGNIFICGPIKFLALKHSFIFSVENL